MMLPPAHDMGMVGGELWLGAEEGSGAGSSARDAEIFLGVFQQSKRKLLLKAV